MGFGVIWAYIRLGWIKVECGKGVGWVWVRCGLG